MLAEKMYACSCSSCWWPEATAWAPWSRRSSSCPAQARPKAGPSQISGNLEIWNLEIWKFGIKKVKKKKIYKIQIRVTQNIGKVWIGRKKSSCPQFMPFQDFCMGRKNLKMYNFCLFSLVGQWVLFTRFGPFVYKRWMSCPDLQSFSDFYWCLTIE